MAAWALGSVPLVLDQAAALADAAALRGLSPRKQPLAAVRLLTLALLVRTVGRSTDLAGALEARGFGQHVPEAEIRSRPWDWWALAATVVWVIASWLLAAGGILGA